MRVLVLDFEVGLVVFAYIVGFRFSILFRKDNFGVGFHQ